LVASEEYGRLGRMADKIVQYRAFRKQMGDEYESVDDYVASKVFDFKCEINPTSAKLKAIYPSLTEPLVVWRENDFPYSLEGDVEHHVLWTTGELTEQMILNAIAIERQGYECVHFINPPHLKSVKNVAHAHIFSRKLAN